ncbi:sodium:solute symporter family protein [Bacillus timonensis]|uniref:sodium:solute symporter family protein n=1 Tax=Bacillus timonensis TaxID=1033734 RepID=UPI0002884A6E|nr:sodium:solute symporter family protein [Bacillus timonensis]
MSLIVYVIIALYLIAALYIGHLTSKNSTAVDYMAAGQNNPYWVVGAGYIAEFLSVSSFLGIVGIIYAQGFMPNGAYVGSVIGYIGCLAIFGPLLRRYGEFTIPDYLGARFDSNLVRGFSALLIFVGYLLYISVQLIGVALLLQLVFDMPYWVGVLISGGIVVIYTFLGGMKATAYVDVFQLFFAWISAAIIICVAVFRGGGMINIVDQIEKYYPTFLTNDAGLGNHWTVWSLIFIWIFGTLARADTVSRVFLAKSEREVYKAVIFVTPFIWAASLMFFFLGMAGKLLIPGLEGTDAESIYLIVAQEWVPPVITGIAFAGLLATAQSTASGQLMVSSLAIGRDIYGKIIGPIIKKRAITESEMVKATKFALIVMSVITVGIAVLKLSWITTFTNLSAATTGPAFLVTWLGGFFWKRSTKTGAVLALIVGAVLGSYTFLSGFSIPSMPWLVAPVFTIIVTAIAFVIGSYIGKPSEKSLAVFNELKEKTLGKSENKNIAS